MRSSSVTFLRREAKRRDIDWTDVAAVYADLRQVERDRRERPNEIRATAWWMHVMGLPASWRFWRLGFLSKFGQRLASGADYTVIPDYDGIAQQIASAFPEYAGDDATEQIWDFLLSPYDRLPTAEELWRTALERVSTQYEVRSMECVPF